MPMPMPKRSKSQVQPQGVAAQWPLVVGAAVGIAAVAFAAFGTLGRFEDADVMHVRGTVERAQNVKGCVCFKLREHDLLFGFRAVGASRTDVHDALASAGGAAVNVGFRQDRPFEVSALPGEYHLVVELDVGGRPVVDRERVQGNDAWERGGLVFFGLGTLLIAGINVARRGR